MVRQYAKYMGIAIVLIGVVGLLLGEQSLLGVLNIDLGEDIVHLATGGGDPCAPHTGSDTTLRGASSKRWISQPWRAVGSQPLEHRADLFPGGRGRP